MHDARHSGAFQAPARVVVLGFKAAARSLLRGRRTLLSLGSSLSLCEVRKGDRAVLLTCVCGIPYRFPPPPRRNLKAASPTSWHPREKDLLRVSHLDACRQRGVRRRRHLPTETEADRAALALPSCSLLFEVCRFCVADLERPGAAALGPATAPRPAAEVSRSTRTARAQCSTHAWDSSCNGRCKVFASRPSTTPILTTHFDPPWATFRRTIPRLVHSSAPKTGGEKHLLSTFEP